MTVFILESIVTNYNPASFTQKMVGRFQYSINVKINDGLTIFFFFRNFIDGKENWGIKKVKSWPPRNLSLAP